MKSNSNKIVKRFLICWIIAVSVMLAGIVTYAAYTNLNSVKRVVSTQGSRGLAFSSNYLNLTPIASDTYALKSLSLAETSDTATFEINICNYVHNDPSKVNENDITYSLTLTLVKPDGTVIKDIFSNPKVTYEDTDLSFDNGVCKGSERTLKGGVKQVDTYSISVPREFINNVNIMAEAIPKATSLQFTDNQKLGRILSFSEKNSSATTWTGSFSETTTDGYDGFNYIIKGQGSGIVTLQWDDANLEISNIFLGNNGLSVGNTNGKKSITIPVNSDVNSRYEIQFYKTENGVYTDISTVNSYVKFSFQAG